jgi:hypothetical protein
MSNRVRDITCHNCGHAWTVDLDELDTKDQTIYRDDKTNTYRVPCPRCHTVNVFQAPDDP